MFADDKQMVLDFLEFDTEKDICYVPGFMRDGSGVFDYGFVAIFDVETQAICNIKAIDIKEYDYLRNYKYWEMSGFTEKSLEWSPLKTLDNIEKTSIKEIFETYGN